MFDHLEHSLLAVLDRGGSDVTPNPHSVSQESTFEHICVLGLLVFHCYPVK